MSITEENLPMPNVRSLLLLFLLMGQVSVFQILSSVNEGFSAAHQACSQMMTSCRASNMSFITREGYLWMFGQNISFGQISKVGCLNASYYL